MALHALNNAITFGVVKEPRKPTRAVRGHRARQRRHRRRRRHRRVRAFEGRRMKHAPGSRSRSCSHSPPPLPPRLRPEPTLTGVQPRTCSAARGRWHWRAARSPPASSCVRSSRARRWTLRVYRSSRKIRVKALTLKSVAGGYGRGRDAEGRVGQVRPGAAEGVAQGHGGAPPAGREDGRCGGRAPERRARRAGAGGALLQARLAAMRYVVSRSGVYDAGTSRAVMACRKVAGMARTTAPPRTCSTGCWRAGAVQGPPPR